MNKVSSNKNRCHLR